MSRRVCPPRLVRTIWRSFGLYLKSVPSRSTSGADDGCAYLDAHDTLDFFFFFSQVGFRPSSTNSLLSRGCTWTKICSPVRRFSELFFFFFFSGGVRMLFASVYSDPTSTSAFLAVFFWVCTSAGGSLAQVVKSVVQTVCVVTPTKPSVQRRLHCFLVRRLWMAVAEAGRLCLVLRSAAYFSW